MHKIPKLLHKLEPECCTNMSRGEEWKVVNPCSDCWPCAGEQLKANAAHQHSNPIASLAMTPPSSSSSSRHHLRISSSTVPKSAYSPMLSSSSGSLLLHPYHVQHDFHSPFIINNKPSRWSPDDRSRHAREQILLTRLLIQQLAKYFLLFTDFRADSVCRILEAACMTTQAKNVLGWGFCHHERHVKHVEIKGRQHLWERTAFPERVPMAFQPTGSDKTPGFSASDIANATWSLSDKILEVERMFPLPSRRAATLDLE